MSVKRKAVFFDRDGVLNEDTGYLYKAEDFCWIEGALEALRFLKDHDYFIVVVTNQSGIARGYYEEKDVKKLHNWMNGELQKKGSPIDAFYYCPHHIEGTIKPYNKECDCRKPKAGMIEAALREHCLDRSQSFLIGDRSSDMTAAEAAKIKGFLFQGSSLLTFVQQVLKELNGDVQ